MQKLFLVIIVLFVLMPVILDDNIADVQIHITLCDKFEVIVYSLKGEKMNVCKLSQIIYIKKVLC